MKENAKLITVDANEAAASVAYRASEVIAIYPITPSSPMGESADDWAAANKPNVWGSVPNVIEMQSEGGAIGAVHGALQGGALVTTFTASQGLLLMIPNLFKIAGELTPFCFHVAARTIAAHALSIFGDHSDVMACRSTGVAMLASNSVQEAQDFAAVAHAATLRSRVPFMHFFDGFRTSHEVGKIVPLSSEQLSAMLDRNLIEEHKKRALTPDRPVLRGTAQNPDVFFQARESCNPFYNACPEIVAHEFARFFDLTGRRYKIFEYHGDPQAERVIVIMGSGAETTHDTVDYLVGKGERVGVLKVRLYRPFSASAFVAELPESVRSIAVLDRTKESGALGEPLYLDVLTALHETGRGQMPRVIGGRYGLSSKEFTPAMVRRVFDELSAKEPKRHFTIGINDDVTHLSLDYDPNFEVLPPEVFQAVFWGLGSDGTVGANKNSIKIIGEETDQYAQGYFVYDSKKAGAVTISHLRFGPKEIHAPYLITKARFVACHQFEFVDRFDVLEYAAQDGVFLLNSPYGADAVWDHLPSEMQKQILDRRLHVYVIDGDTVARENGMGRRVNTVMQTCFFALAGVLPRDEAIGKIKQAITKTYGKKGPEVVQRNIDAVDATLANLHEVKIAGREARSRPRAPVMPKHAPEFIQRVTAVMAAGKGDLLPVSAFPIDGTWPTGTTKWEKRNLAQDIPVWDSKICIQCNKCALVCPHAAIRAKVYDPAKLQGAPEGFKSTDWKGLELKGNKYTIQVAPEDCTGCGLCVEICPAKDKSNPKHKAIDMEPQRPVREAEAARYAFFLDLPEVDRKRVKLDVKESQLMMPLFEYSGACAGCGETPYIKLMSQLFGDRAIVANATGCSSIYSGNLPTTPYTKNGDGRGPAWSNSLFEDNAEFGLGLRLAVNSQTDRARMLLRGLSDKVGAELTQKLLDSTMSDETEIEAQRQRVAELRAALASSTDPAARELCERADYLVKKSVWIIGGDGWAYDIGFGGLDHVLAQQHKINVLVLDTEVYSNTGGQQSKATPLGAVAKFASAGKQTPKKDLGLIAMSYGHVYVARVAIGAKDAQTVRAFVEADAHPGPSLIIAYSHCIAHGYDLKYGPDQQKLAVDCGVWPIYRYDPERAAQGEPPLKIDAPPGKGKVADYMRRETRFRLAEKLDPKRFAMLAEEAQKDANRRVAFYQQLAELRVPKEG